MPFTRSNGTLKFKFEGHWFPIGPFKADMGEEEKGHLVDRLNENEKHIQVSDFLQSTRSYSTHNFQLHIPRHRGLDSL